MGSIRRERVVVSVFLLLICATLAQAVHNGWYLYNSGIHSHLGEPEASLIYAPEGYRVGMPALSHLVTKVTRIQDTALISAGFDFVAGFFACYLFYRLAVRFLPATEVLEPKRALVAALFLAMIQFPVAWVVPWQRPETLPTSLYLSVVFFLFVREKRSALWLPAVLAATVIQCFFRTDVPLFLGAALVLLSLIPKASDDLWPKRSLFLLGCSIAVVSACVQAYLQYVLLPHLSRRTGEPLITLGLNLHTPHFLLVFAVAASPFLILTAFLAVRRPALDLVDKLILVVSALYLFVWFVVGIVSEVRLFVPFMLALSTVAAKALGSFLNVASDSGVDQGGVQGHEAAEKTKKMVA